MLVKVFGFLLDVWHEPSVHQSLPPVLAHHNAQHFAFAAGVVICLAHA